MEQDSKPGRNGSIRWALVALSLMMLMPSLATSSTNIALPSLAQTFGVSFQTTQWIVLSYLLTITALIVAAGRLGDIFGRRRLLLIGTAIFAGGSLLCGVAPGIEALVVARIVQGSGAAMMIALTMAFVGEVVPPERTGFSMGLLGAMSAVGTTLGPAIGGLLIAWAGSRAIFLVNVPLATLALLLALPTLPEDPPRAGSTSPNLDIAGMSLLAIALTAYVLSITTGNGQFGLLNIAFLVAAFAASIAFVTVETRVPSPLLRLDLLRNRSLVAGLSANMIVSNVMMATLIIGPFYIAKVIGFGPAAAGLILAAGPLVAAVAGVPAGRLVDQFGARIAALGGLAGLMAGAATLSLVPSNLGVAGYVVPIIGMTAGYSLFQAANNAAILTGTSAAERGVVSGVLNLSRNLGLVTGASAMGAIFAWGAAAPDIVTASSRSITTGLHWTFLVATILIVAALLISLRAQSGNPQGSAEIHA